jgi:hypothetical protein
MNLTVLVCVYYIIYLDPNVQDAQTKRRYVNPWCEDDGDMVGLGAAGP